MRKNLQLWLAPSLLAIFPTLAIYNHNLDQLALHRTFMPLAYSLGLVLLSGLVALTLFKSARKASLFTSLWIILFFSYGYLYLKLGETALPLLLPFSLNIFLLGLVGVALLIGWWWLSKNQPTTQLSNFVLVVAITTLFLNLITIVPFEFRRWQTNGKLTEYLVQQPVITTTPTEIGVKPDIIYVVFDRYARQDVLAEQFKFDNEEILEFLEDNNFLVGRESFANYPNTFLSLSSSLNMRYLDFLSEIMGIKNQDRISVYQQLIQTNEVARFLKSQGYQYILAGSFWDPSKTSLLADLNYNLFADFDEFQLYVYERSLSNTLRGVLENKQLYTGVERLERMAKNLDFRLNALKKQMQNDSPQFIFAHFLLPHEPHLFDGECLPLELTEVRELTPEAGFLQETQCANTIMKELTEYAQTKTNRPIVLIFQSDEGPYLPSQYFNINEELVPQDQLAYHIHTAILNAIYLPSKDDPRQTADYQALGLDKQSSPVNTFRAILNYYFSANLPLLENKSYVFASPEEPYHFLDITNQLSE